MISSDRQILLNSSTTTVSSFLSLFLCLFSSPFILLSRNTRKDKYNHENSSSFSTSVATSSLISSLSLLFATIILSYLMCQELVAAESSTPPQYWISWNYGTDNQSQLGTENSSFAKNIFPDDMTLNDEPPRDFSASGVPSSWNVQPHDRLYYMRAENEQYLQIYDGKVTGTKESKPPFGIVRFWSHRGNLVIQSFMDNQFLCMNETSVLYLSTNGDDPACHLEENDLWINGSHSTVYHFSKYSSGKKLYLGIDCDPMLGTQAEQYPRTYRFTRLDINEKDAKKVKEQVEKDGREHFVKKKCISSAARRRTAKAKRRKLRARWCLNLDRMIQKRVQYMHNCMKRERSRSCDRNDNGNKNSKRCVCNILKNMLSNPKRAKRKCLKEKLTKWIEKRDGTPNSKAVVEASKLLVRNYAGIARRTMQLKARKQLQLQRQYEKSQVEKKEQSDKRQSTTDSLNKQPVNKQPLNKQPVNKQPVNKPPVKALNEHHPRRHEASKNRKHRKRRRRVIKVNKILKQYGHELIISSPGAQLNNQSITTGRTTSLSHVTQSSTFRKHKEPSVLSDEFKRVLNSLSTEPHTRRSHRGHRRKRRKYRQKIRNSSQIESKIQDSFTDSVSDIKSLSSSPG